MLTGSELSASIDKLFALRKEIVNAFIDTFIMLGISTTVAIVIGGLFGVFLFLSSDRQFLQNKTLYGLLGGITNFMRAFPFVILMIAMSHLRRLSLAQVLDRLRPHWYSPLQVRFILPVWSSKTYAKCHAASLRRPNLWAHVH